MIADCLAALADPTRRRIFEIVAEGPTPVGEIAQRVPVSRPAVSQHLRVLRDAGLVRQQRLGTRHVHSLDASGLAVVRSYFDEFWERSLTAYKVALEGRGASHATAHEEAP